MEPRKASEVLLELESKVEVLLNLAKAQDLNIKILSNKLNQLMEASANKPVIPSFTAETTRVAKPAPVVTEKSIPISSEESFLKEENFPEGFRRTSRPDTFTQPVSEAQPITKLPTQIPKSAMPMAEIKVPQHSNKEEVINTPKDSPPTKPDVKAIPVAQRVVNINNKAVFLANVEVIDSVSLQTVTKTRTNGAGKWMASLNPGKYRILINKKEDPTKDKLEVAQNVKIEGSGIPLELPLIILK